MVKAALASVFHKMPSVTLYPETLGKVSLLTITWLEEGASPVTTARTMKAC